MSYLVYPCQSQGSVRNLSEEKSMSFQFLLCEEVREEQYQLLDSHNHKFKACLGK